MKIRWLGVAVLVAALASAGASSAWAQVVVDPELLRPLYSLDFEEAETKFERLTRENPANPTYWNLLASSIWLKIVFEQEKLNLESFAGSKLGGEGSDDIVREEREARLRAVVARAIASAQAMVAEDPDDIEALYALGVAHGMLASFEATVKRAYLAANGEAKKAREYHMRVLELDPSYADARLTIGTYDYAIGVIPRFLRFLLGVIGIRGGDREGGIEQIEYAAELGRRSSVNAKMVLVVVYNREKEHEKALSVLNDLHAAYPRNFLLEMAKASVHERMENWDQAVRVYERVLGKVRSGRDGYDRLEPELVLFKLGEANVHRLELDPALAAFREILRSDEATDELKGRAHLWMGKIHDSRESRAEALVHYEAVLRLDCDDDLKDEARRFKRRPFEG